MKHMDWHCDTLSALNSNETLKQSPHMVTLDELRQSDTLLQACAAFIPTGYYYKKAAEDSSFDADAEIRNEFERIYKNYKSSLQSYPEELAAVLSGTDVEVCLSSGKTGILFTIEDGGVLGADLKNIDLFYEKGVRLVTLTWNHENALGFPHSCARTIPSRGLKPFGLEAVSYMEEKGIIIDVSHLSDDGFYDVANVTRKPFVASHSNARAVCPHSRNLTDDMIRILAERGGIIGLNFYYAFLQPGTKKTECEHISRIEDMVRHTLHIYQTGGEDVLALGSDFDGIDGILEIARPTDTIRLADALKKAGLSERIIEKMWWQNGRRVLEEVL